MIPKEILKKIRRIEITTSHLVTDVFAGQYHSVFKGQGIEFDEVREYNPGDDIRSIDWNVTARTGTVHVKKYVEERELTVMVLVDASGSSYFGTVNQLKSSLAAEIAAVLAFSAIRNNDKVGLIIFSDGIERFIPPRKGSRHVLRVIREILYFKPKGKGTNIPAALDYLNKVTRHKTVSFLISDFLQDEAGRRRDKNSKNPLKQTLVLANKRHDLIAITLNDPKEMALENSGLIILEDAETGKRVYIDSSDPRIRQEFAEIAKKRIQEREALLNSVRVDRIDVATDKPYSQALVKFFKQRQKRFR
ncbi:MAG: hypothetical protein A2Z88_10055 [Omnitrophica WOR_2 bacterium GWA2_47_8]|nr:MAG: hypothetical protein A2Z88_10055 [Omnitrophica WOR_2 bacterium GWA2_47_8]